MQWGVQGVMALEDEQAEDDADAKAVAAAAAFTCAASGGPDCVGRLAGPSQAARAPLLAPSPSGGSGGGGGQDISCG